ncbi:hypothetical protein RF11_14617 [Thelohanellus kitauei]|uniref:Uncharacterized protein n=1 Tax=Thelohanellus kitauei TaxID=669202 RepID=A0A0C2JPT1_THEKT|nr:hypothetical protein RF11_14617 [Thelohanellus kitauei]
MKVPILLWLLGAVRSAVGQGGPEVDFQIPDKWVIDVFDQVRNGLLSGDLQIRDEHSSEIHELNENEKTLLQSRRLIGVKLKPYSQSGKSGVIFSFKFLAPNKLWQIMPPEQYIKVSRDSNGTFEVYYLGSDKNMAI